VVVTFWSWPSFHDVRTFVDDDDDDDASDDGGICLVVML
jgi:hypothetical protein